MNLLSSRYHRNAEMSSPVKTLHSKDSPRKTRNGASNMNNVLSQFQLPSKKDKQTPTQHQDGRRQLRRRENSETFSQESEDKDEEEEEENYKESNQQAKILRSPSIIKSRTEDSEEKDKDSSSSEAENGGGKALRSSVKATRTPAKREAKTYEEKINKNDKTKDVHGKRYVYIQGRKFHEEIYDLQIAKYY